MDARRLAQENRILEVRVGSHLFGTDTPDSDLDLFGVFMPWDETLFGFQRCEEVDLSTKIKDDTGRNTAEAVDRKLHDYRKFVRLLMQNNPNILHVIMADDRNVVFKDEHGFADRLLAMGPRFPHRGAHHRFVKYAQAQQHKMLIKPQNYKALEEGLAVLDELDPNQVLADVMVYCDKRYVQGGAPFVDKGRGKHVQCGDLHFERGVFVKKVSKKIRERLSKATSRAQLFTKYGYDVKFASNLIQLLREGIELMNTGWIQMPLAYAQDVLDVKQGKYTAEEIARWADELVEEARDAYEHTLLPKEPDAHEIENFLMCEVWKWAAEYTRQGGEDI